MVKDPRKTAGAGTYQPLNIPMPVIVEENASGLPEAIAMAQRRQTIAAIEDSWRIDDEWWRSKPVSRLYYSILLTSGQALVLYKDINEGKWYRQAR